MKQNLSSSEINQYQQETNSGLHLIHAGDYTNAATHIAKAHALGHADKKLHLKTHRLLIQIGWLQHSPVQVITQSLLLVAAWIFD